MASKLYGYSISCSKSALVNEIKNMIKVSTDNNSILLKDFEIKELSNRFSVSYQTMVYRLQSLEILRK